MKIKRISQVLVLIFLTSLTFLATAQRPDRPEQSDRGPGGGRSGRIRRLLRRFQIADQFDADKDGKLSREERKAAQGHMHEQREGNAAQSRPSGRTAPNTDVETLITESKAATPDGAPDFYDPDALRTVYLRFHDEDWYEQLGDFYHTDVDVPADMVVDGKVYQSVGVRFRGTSSYFTIMDSEKKSFNIDVNFSDDDLRLYGYRTLNLLNGHADPSFLREVLFSRLARDYIPTTKANFVKLVINGESWGVYINAQQFNRDFLEENFGTRGGVRWKIPPSFDAEGGLSYIGDDLELYKKTFVIKSRETPEAWEDLMNLCRTFSDTPDEEIEAALKPIFDIDGALWFIALENVLTDHDSYINKGKDYALYQDPTGRFHPISIDNNETFRFAGGRGPGQWPDGDNPMLSPDGHSDNPDRPIISRLLAIPHLRARYFAHVRTVVNELLDWEKLRPIIENYQVLIGADVQADDKKLYAYEGFANSVAEDFQSQLMSMGPPGGARGGRPGGPPGGGRGGGGPGLPSFKHFVKARRDYLLNYPEIDKPTPVIQSVSVPSNPKADGVVQITAEIGSDVAVDSVILYYATKRLSPFESVPMSAEGGTYIGEIPAQPAGTKVRYYVEARAPADVGTTVFAPEKAEFAPFTY